MPDPVAPTLNEILSARYELSVFCAACRVIVPKDALDLALSRPIDIPVDRFKFRCRTCRKIGRVRVQAAGNCTIGFPTIWPPD